MQGPASSNGPLPADQARDSIQRIGQDMKNLIKKIQDIRHLGIEDSNIALPKICVIGDQSAGKSSLIEGMSEIRVPRGDGTCTRCPMEINLSESEPGQPWSCRVLLSRKYMYDGSNKIRVPKKSKPLGPWIEQYQEDELFVSVTSKEELQDAIKWAQLAILNPRRPTAEFVPGQNDGTDAKYYEVKFSPNVVRLDIAAPNFPNFSFYDLPGVIVQPEQDEEWYLVSLIQNLAKEYISKDSCIVLLALSMTTDPNTSSAAGLLRKINGAQDRTLGVLTKPDRLQLSDTLLQWTEMLNGNTFPLGHGYYVVRNNQDPTVEHSVARDEEVRFFATRPWSDELVEYGDRFGTRRVQNALSCLLLEQIQGCLPRIIQQISDKAARINAELATLPEPPSTNVQYVLCNHLNQLKDQIRCHIDGGSAKYPLQRRWNRMALDFKLALRMTRPTLQLLTTRDRAQLSASSETDASDCEILSTEKVSSQGPLKRKRGVESGTPAPSETKVKREAGDDYLTDHFKAFDRAATEFGLEQIREINEDSRRAGIPDQTDPKAIEIMNQHSVIHWDKPMRVFLDISHKLVGDMLQDQIDAAFSRYRQTSLYRELNRIVGSYLHGLKMEHVKSAEENYNIECNKPFTLATSDLERETKAALAYLQARRFASRARHYVNNGKTSPSDSRRVADIKKVTEEDLGPDEFVQEVKMMASSRGYYEIASSRFVDSICQSVHTKLFSKCREQLIAEIENKLGIHDNNALDRCMELMAEDPERLRRRRILLKEKEKITKAQEWLATATKEDEGTMVVEGIMTEAVAVAESGVRVKTQPRDDDEWTLMNF